MESQPSEGARLAAAALARRGWSQGDLQRELNLSRGLVSKWLAGHQRPSRSLAAKIAKLLRVPPEAWDQPARSAA